MKKKTLSIILFVCVIVAGFFIYQIGVKDGGVVKIAWNGTATQVNKVWQGLWGDSNATLMGYWDSSEAQSTVSVDDDDEDVSGAMSNAVD